MSYIPGQAERTGVQLSTTFIWDVALIQEIDPNSPQFKELLIRLYQNIANISDAVNRKQNGMYTLTEVVAGKIYYATNPENASDFRQGFFKEVNFGALPNTGTKSVAHGVAFDANYRLMNMYAAATDPVSLIYLPIPYASPVLANNIEMNADATNVNITTGSNRSAFTSCSVLLDYVKQA